MTITVHEVAHAWMANRLGDPTAKLMGRLSLNPFVHYDPVGTTLLLATAFLTVRGFLPFPFGWAKPVQFDPYNLKNPQRDSAIISFAGPGANLILATLLSIILRFSFLPLISPFILLNISLAVFNLIPIHPLDGGKILIGLLPPQKARGVDLFLNRFGVILLFFLIFPVFGGIPILNRVIFPIINFLFRLLTGNQVI